MSKYQGRVQPLQLLRNAYIESRKLRTKDKYLLFQKDIRLPLSQLTAWVSPLSNKQYTIGSLWLYLEHHLGRISDYLSKVSEIGVQLVIISDREQIANYFLGLKAESTWINQEAKLQLSMKNNAQRQQPTTGLPAEQGAEPTKKQKVENVIPPLELQVIELIYKFQRPTSSKSRSLRCQNKSFQSLLELLKQNTNQPITSGNDDRKMRINTFMEQKKNPIIVVPEHLHPGNLCLGNIVKFLVNGQYSESMGDMGFKRWTQLDHAIRGKNFKFDVTNNPSILRQQDWNFVVAVFVEGKRRQFDTWAIKEPVELFRKTKGFLLRFTTKEMSEAQEWNVKIMTLDKNVRYRDSEVRNAIWKDIQSYLSQKI